MLESVKISRRQSEIRQESAALSVKEKPDENEVRAMEALDAEYRTNETRYRSALIAEDSQRKAAGVDLETREGRQWNDLVDRFEVRQIVHHFNENRPLEGATAEAIQEMRAHGSYQGVPIPMQVVAQLEKRAGETVAGGVIVPKFIAPIIDRLFPASCAARMGANLFNIVDGNYEVPVTTSSVSSGWAATETGAVGAASAYQTTSRTLTPSNTLGIQMKITRKTMKQAGDALEAAVRRDMSGAISQALDQAIFLGTGSSGQPLGVIAGQSTYAYTTTAVGAAATWAAFRAAIVTFMIGNALNSPADVRILMRPEVWSKLDNSILTSTAVSELDRLVKNCPNIVLSSNALAAPVSSASTCLLTTDTNGVAPIYCGLYGGVDLIRDVITQASSGLLLLTALITADVTISRSVQIQSLTGVGN